MEYTLTTYNIFKLHLPFSRQYVGTLEKHSHFLAIQEWVDSLHIAKDKTIVTEETFTIPFRKEKTGTAIISSFTPIDSKTFTSLGRELGFVTLKSAIISSYEVDGTILTIFNCHGLNFVNNGMWRTTMDYWIDQLPENGACVVAGDFNTWNPWRFDYLERKLKDAGFRYAHYDHNMIVRLDHIWHRGVEATSCTTNMNVHTSDHYPVTLTFTL